MKADSLEELMNNMFNREFLEMRNPNACFSMSLAIKEQHNNTQARKCVSELFYGYSINSMQADFDRLINKGLIPPSDTKTIAAILMFGVIAINDIRLHEYISSEPIVDYMKIYNDLKELITSVLLKGNENCL